MIRSPEVAGDYGKLPSYILGFPLLAAVNSLYACNFKIEAMNTCLILVVTGGVRDALKGFGE